MCCAIILLATDGSVRRSHGVLIAVIHAHASMQIIKSFKACAARASQIHAVAKFPLGPENQITPCCVQAEKKKEKPVCGEEAKSGRDQ